MRISNTHESQVKRTHLDEKFNGVTLKYTIDIDKNATNSHTNGADSKKGVE